jgi:hypothetical protein
LVDEASRALVTVKAAWPRVLMPDDDILVSGGGVADFPADEVRGDWACEHGPTNDDSGTAGSVDPLPEGPSRALLSVCSSSPSMGAEAALNT